MSLVYNEIRNHIESKFEKSVVNEFPFPHLIIEDFFPEKIFAQIMSLNLFRNNSGQEWISKTDAEKMKTLTPYYARKQIDLLNDSLIGVHGEKGLFWKMIRDCLLEDNWFVNLVYKKYPSYFNIRFGEFVNTPDFHRLLEKELFLQRHEIGYYIGPHTDIPRRIFTCIFSFAEKEGFDRFGTELCAPVDPLKRCWGNDHYSYDEFKIEKVAPYRPNNFLLFFKTRQSFHSVCEIDGSVPNERFGMQFQFYEPINGVFSDMSMPDLMVTKHHKKNRMHSLI